MNSGGVGEPGKLELFVGGMVLYRQGHLVIFERCRAGGILAGARRFMGGDRACSLRELFREYGIGDVGEEAIRVLVIDPLFQALFGGRFIEEVDFSYDGKAFVLVADRQS